MVYNELWWNGPLFLQSANYASEPPESLSGEELPELKLTFFVSAIVYNADNLPVFTKFSSFRKLQRVIVYVKRFI